MLGSVSGVGFGFMYLCAYVMIGHYFDKRRALATGIASCGSGVGTFLFAPLSVELINWYGWIGSMWIISGIVLNGVVCGATFAPVERSLPLKLQTEPENERKKPKLMDWSLLKNPPFMVFCFSSFLCLIGE